jgi:hypothetical protein
MNASLHLDDEGLRRFDEAVSKMPRLLEQLLEAPAHRVSDHPSVPNSPGIYLFSQDGEPVYVGQSRKLRQRLRHHTDLLSGQNRASFAFNIAKRDAGLAGLDVARFRQVLEADVDFAEHFDRAKHSVADMTVQLIELADPIERTIFEMYAALALHTSEFNSFETH